MSIRENISRLEADLNTVCEAAKFEFQRSISGPTDEQEAALHIAMTLREKGKLINEAIVTLYKIDTDC